MRHPVLQDYYSFNRRRDRFLKDIDWDAILLEKPLNIFKSIGKVILHDKKCWLFEPPVLLESGRAWAEVVF